jgi:acyl-CoA reductase-like NAD-dependent aldehyde dehydrogenase
MTFDTVSCRKIQREWSLTPLPARLRCVRNFRHLLAERADELTAAVHQDVGRPPAEVLGSDVLPLAAACRYLEKNAKKLLAQRSSIAASYGRRQRRVVETVGAFRRQFHIDSSAYR